MIIVIPVTWTKYTTTINGQIVKLVPCEGCGTEYTYVLEREGVGTGNSVYGLSMHGPNEDPATHSRSAAEDTLQQYLENDFDAVPCPVCGHYQKFMFPKLYKQAIWLQLARIAAMVACSLSGVITLFRAFKVLGRPENQAQPQFIAGLLLLATFGAIAALLGAIERSRANRFDPNAQDRELRIKKGQELAMTRAQFEASRQQAQSSSQSAAN